MGLTTGSPRRVGPACAVVGVLGFSFRAVLTGAALVLAGVMMVTMRPADKREAARSL